MDQRIFRFLSVAGQQMNGFEKMHFSDHPAGVTCHPKRLDSVRTNLDVAAMTKSALKNFLRHLHNHARVFGALPALGISSP